MHTIDMFSFYSAFSQVLDGIFNFHDTVRYTEFRLSMTLLNSMTFPEIPDFLVTVGTVSIIRLLKSYCVFFVNDFVKSHS